MGCVPRGTPELLPDNLSAIQRPHTSRSSELPCKSYNCAAALRPQRPDQARSAKKNPIRVLVRNKPGQCCCCASHEIEAAWLMGPNVPPTVWIVPFPRARSSDSPSGTTQTQIEFASSKEGGFACLKPSGDSLETEDAPGLQHSKTMNSPPWYLPDSTSQSTT